MAQIGTEGQKQPRDALQLELEVHIAEYERVWRHVDTWIELRSTLVRYIIAGSVAGFAALLAFYKPEDRKSVELLSNILLVIPILFIFVTLGYLGHYRIITAFGDYICFFPQAANPGNHS